MGTKLPLIKLPPETQNCLYLIKEELKCRKLFHVLHLIGLDDCYFQPHLDSLIMGILNMDDGRDETFSIYDKIMERRSRKIDADNDSIMKQALKVYHELLDAKKGIKSSQTTLRKNGHHEDYKR
jgi:hypothetical protein